MSAWPRRFNCIHEHAMEENVEGKYILASDADVLLISNKTQEEEVRQLRAEIATLRAWKTSAMEVDSQWEPMRRFARLRGARLGHSLAEESARIANELESENKTLRAKLATMVCGTCRGTGCTHGHRGCTCHPCPVCQPKGNE